MRLKILFFTFLAAVIFLVGTTTAVYFEKDNAEFLAFLSLVFTGLAAIATAWAARSASKSARIAEVSAETWKRQMRLNIELEEAKRLKLALSSWYRHFIGESYRYSDQDLVRIGELQDIGKRNDARGKAQHIQGYLDTYKNLWNSLEESFDNASFIESDFEGRLRLRRLSLNHMEACSNLLAYFQGEIENTDSFMDENCSAIYACADWHELDLTGIKLSKVELEIPNKNGKLEYVKKSNGDNVYVSFHEDVQSWYSKIGSDVDAQIARIKSSVSPI
ncbi:hypothetical protein [Microbulbifer pacificus]|uniref:hypothetical protein n=1 Tax=Microbulbifer pacificus TaxID=407164 RepID=UPI000CF3C4F5|nr:hypothetical protein [Microbulbifer pacificus]